MTDEELNLALSKMSAHKIDILEALNDQQKVVAINYKGPSFVTAGAGAGMNIAVLFQV